MTRTLHDLDAGVAAVWVPMRDGVRLAGRLDLASSNFPCFDRNSGTAQPAGRVTGDDLVTATQQVFFGPAAPSAIRLPVIPPA